MTERPFTILSTGSAEQTKIPSFGAVVVPPALVVEEIPFIRILLNTDSHTRYEVNRLGSAGPAVLFTSANAVRAVAALLNKKPDWTIYCLGHTTRRQAVLAFGEAAIARTASDAASLAGEIIAAGVSSAFFFCGDQRRDVLPEKLSENGIRLGELVVYRTEETPVKLTKHFDAILFFSPTAVRSFFSLNSALPGTTLFALGSATAEALAQHSDNEIIRSPDPEKNALLQLAIDYGQSHPIS